MDRSKESIEPDLYEFMRTELAAKGEEHAAGYQSASPFPHAVIDDFLPREIAERILDLYPGEDFAGFEKPDYKNHQVKKLARVQESAFAGIDPELRNILHDFNSMVFLDFLEKVTGIPGLIGDPSFSGGAFHQILPGGKLDVHADFNIDQRRRLRRRINVLLYLNKDWKDEYAGHLELWSRDMSRREHSIAPIFNRCVIFNTGTDTYHGHPHPLACPRGMTRKSLAFYYYASDRTAFDDAAAHSTLWQAT
jgi:hypothetical protein